MHYGKSLLLSAGLVLGLAWPARPLPQQGGDDLPFQQYADAFAKKHLKKKLAEEVRTIPAALQTGYVKARLGLFEVWFPFQALHEKESANRLKEAATALLQAQENWIGWAGDDSSQAQLKKDFPKLEKWVRSWKGPKLAKIRQQGDGLPDLTGLLKPGDPVKEASGNFARLMRQGTCLKDGPHEEEGLPIILSPTRRDFLELGSFIGSLNDMNRQILWKNGLAMGTSYPRAGHHVLALEHPSTWPGRGDITRGMDMNSREKSGLGQHVIHHAMGYLLALCYGDRLPEYMVSGMSMNMVIALYKENNVRAGGGTKGRKTESYSKFVAGGASSGGKLAAKNADCRWRQAKGKGHFLKELRAAQKAGAKLARKAMKTRNSKPLLKTRDSHSFFALESEAAGMDDFLLQAPILLLPRKTPPGPEEYQEDFLEFHRAYRCAFTYWLMNKGSTAASRAEPETLFQSVMQNTGMPMERGHTKTFLEAVQEVYGLPLARKDSKTPTLETKFLEWLAKR